MPDATLDVRSEPPARRHSLIFDTYGTLDAGSGFELVNDHDPKPLRYQFEAEHAGAPEISHMDGLRVEYPQWWFSLRPSNTEPVLRLNLEADDQDILDEHLAELVEVLQGR